MPTEEKWVTCDEDKNDQDEGEDQERDMSRATLAIGTH
jgi:hypothetical protein